MGWKGHLIALGALGVALAATIAGAMTASLSGGAMLVAGVVGAVTCYAWLLRVQARTGL